MEDAALVRKTLAGRENAPIYATNPASSKRWPLDGGAGEPLSADRSEQPLVLHQLAGSTRVCTKYSTPFAPSRHSTARALTNIW